jgi:Fe-S-cluster-containing hydrogenase component 2
MFYNPETQKALKCNLCGGTPACATVCPTAAIEYVEAETADWLAGFASDRLPLYEAHQLTTAERR